MDEIYTSKFESLPVKCMVMRIETNAQYESGTASRIAMGGTHLTQFESLSSKYICIGGEPARIFYESVDLLAEAKLIYGWVKDKSGQVNDHGKQALYLRLTELA